MTKLTLKNITDETLISYVDGELSSKEMEEVSALISQSASLKLRVDNHQDLSTQLKTFFSEGMDDTPDYIATKIHNLVDTYEESKDNSSLFSNVIAYVGKKFTPSWDNFNGLTKVAAGVAVGIIASPYLFDKDINTSFIVKQQQENFIEKKTLVQEQKLRGLSSDQVTKQPVLELKGDTCVDTTGFGISTNYSGKIVEKNICEFSDMSPSIIEGVPFSISIVSPFSGKMSVVELLNSETNIIISDLDVIAEKSYTIPESGMLELTDQAQLTLEILFSGSGIKYSRIINFDVIPANSD